jgi:acyl-homoserine-lactone acylase
MRRRPRGASRRTRATGRFAAAVTGAAIAIGGVAGASLAGAGPAQARPSAPPPGYRATIVRTSYGIPHITAHDFGSLGYGYGFSLATDEPCTMASGYVTVEGQRSRYFGAGGSYTFLPGDTLSNVGSDAFWQSATDRGVIPRLLAVRTGPRAIAPRARQLMAGYVAGYNGYLASVGGRGGVPDRSCRGKAWVKPITTLDAYLMVYEFAELQGQAADADAIAGAQPPAPGTASLSPAPRTLSLSPASAALLAAMGSNAIAVGSAGNADHQHGMLLGNPHFVWQGPGRMYQVQLTIPGVLNVEGATLFGMPLVAFGFTATMAWSQTSDSTASTITPYQLTLVPGHPTEYLVDGKPEQMTSVTVTVPERAANGGVKAVRRTLWSTRYGPMIDGLHGHGLPWTTTTGFALADANAGNLRMLNHYLATDQARSVADELAILKKYQGLPWFNTLAADSSGHALYAGIVAIPDVTDAEAARCDTAIGAISFAQTGLPILDGSRSSCAWGTDQDSAVPGIFGPREEPVLLRGDFTENSNDSYWMTNPAQPLTGFPRVIGQSGLSVPGAEGADLGLRTRSALTMIARQASGAGASGFTFSGLKSLMYSDIQYGATLVKGQLVAMCRAFPGGQAPTSNGPGTIAVGDSCNVLAAWDGKENPGSRGAVLFRAFWGNALALPGGPWSHPFTAADPVATPYGLDTASTSVQQAFGDALAMTAAHEPYGTKLGSVQYVLRDGTRIPLPGGPGDPDGEFNAIYQAGGPGTEPDYGTTYIQAVTWKSGDPCPEAATMLASSESDNPGSPHYADQTRLFPSRGWATGYFCPAQVAAHATSTIVVGG